MNKHNVTNDQPTTEDLLLGTSGFIEKIAQDIKHSAPPKTISITGYWGSGKTSALAMLFKSLTGVDPLSNSDDDPERNEQYIGIWFEAWKYQQEEHPIVALLQEIKKSFSTSEKFINKAGKLASVSFLGALTVLDGVIKTATGISSLNKVKDIGEAYEKENLLSRLSSDHVSHALMKAVDTLLNEGANDPQTHKKLVIFIDDLDRCEDGTALKLLEQLKIYLNIPNCIVVMALDSHQIESNVNNRLSNGGNDLSFRGVEYMEKLCQESYRLPIPNAVQKSTFICKLLEFLLTDLEVEGKSFVKDLSNVIPKYDCLPANPRRLKMMASRVASIFRYGDIEKLSSLNTYCSENNIPNNTRDELYSACVLIVASLSVSYRRVFERLEQSPKFLSEIIGFCNNQTPNSYTDNSSVFFDFHKMDASTRSTVQHPSDLGVFRLSTFFLEGANSLETKYDVKDYVIGDTLHEIINQYNYS